MSKSGKETLFKEEKKVLKVLQKNARGDIEDIAKNASCLHKRSLGLSRN